MPFHEQDRGHPVDYLVAAATHIRESRRLLYSTDFWTLVTTAFLPIDPTTDAERLARRKPNSLEAAATTAIVEAVALALARGDVEVVPAILGLGVPLAMRLERFSALRRGQP
jgi:hypothetical protein